MLLSLFCSPGAVAVVVAAAAVAVVAAAAATVVAAVAAVDVAKGGSVAEWLGRRT